MKKKKKDKKKDKSLLIIKEETCIKFFFLPKKYHISEKKLLEVLNGLLCINECTGYDAERIFAGEVWVFFNPTCHDAGNRRRVIKKVCDVIKKDLVDIRDDDIDIEDIADYY